MPPATDSCRVDSSPTARQFRLIDIVAGMTMASLFLAILAPVLRHLSTPMRWRVLSVLCVQMVCLFGYWFYAGKRRHQVLQIAGEPWGVGYRGNFRWRNGPVMVSCVQMILLAAVQLVLSLSLLGGEPQGGAWWALMIQVQIQQTLVTGGAFTRYLWRVYVNAVEFFGEGIVTSGLHLIPWSNIEVRRSQFFADRLVMVVRPVAGPAVGCQTFTVQANRALCDHIMSLRNARENHPGEHGPS